MLQVLRNFIFIFMLVSKNIYIILKKCSNLMTLKMTCSVTIKGKNIHFPASFLYIFLSYLSTYNIILIFKFVVFFALKRLNHRAFIFGGNPEKLVFWKKKKHTNKTNQAACHWPTYSPNKQSFYIRMCTCSSDASAVKRGMMSLLT